VSQVGKGGSRSRHASAEMRRIYRGVKRRGTDALRAAQGKPPIDRPRPNPLKVYFDNNPGRVIYKWVHYFDIYHRHFERFRDRPVTIVEFGVFKGGSLQMWRHYFGPRAHIVGVDINPRCADLADGDTEILIGDQEDREFLRSLAQRLGKVDIVIDDGGHTMLQQLTTFEEFWPHIADGGVYLVEDLHTSYWAKWGGGYRKPGTFIEFAKNLIDQQHAWHSRDKSEFDVDVYTRTIKAMHVYDSVIVFDKGTVTKPYDRKTGSG
jgi:methyltransferase family protein